MAADAATNEAAARLGQNVRQLRAARGLTQAQMARLAGLPRATWANLETGAANPTLAVLERVAGSLQVTLEELVQAPRAAVQHYPRGGSAMRSISMPGIASGRRRRTSTLPRTRVRSVPRG